MLEYVEKNKKFEHRKSLNVRRCNFTAIYESKKFLNRIYVIGGRNDRNVLKACEYYDIKTDKWVKMDELKEARHDAACCVFNSKQIYVFGGRTSDGCETYNIEKDIWEVINVGNKQTWVPCDLAMCYQISPTLILISGGRDKKNYLT